MRLSIRVDEATTVSALLRLPGQARACYVLAHGAGAGMTHPFMVAVAEGCFERRIATLRYQFPFMERGSRRPDPPRVAHATVRAAVLEASRRVAGLPLLAGGRSFGGRMTSQAHKAVPLPGVRGLIFLGFPLHPSGKPAVERAQHLFETQCPLLFIQGTKDALADARLMRSLVQDLGRRATMESIAGADHALHVPARTGRKDAEVLDDMLDVLAGWIDGVIADRAVRR